MKQGMYVEIAKIAFATIIVFAALVITAGQKIDLENLAKGEQNTSRIEEINGKPYTACTVKDIKALLDTYGACNRKSACNSSSTIGIWLGNSQLHYINQYHTGDHLSPYWLRASMGNPECIELLGISVPNANFQEYLILNHYTQMKLPVKLLIVEMVFDDLREDGLRNDFADILTTDNIETIRQKSTSAEYIVDRFLATQKVSGDINTKSVFSGTIQEPVELWLNHKLSSVWSLWASRSQIGGDVLYGMYCLRNAVFGIKPTTVRKMIRTRYDLNMGALTDMLADCKRSGMPALLYIAPIRQDKPIPYDATEYTRWKFEVDLLAKQYGVKLINLEALVPSEFWGSYAGDEIDFMHFQGSGHRLVADALLPHVKGLLAERDR